MNNFIEENFKIILIFGTIYLIAIITILIFIWMPEKKAPEFATYSLVDENTVNKITLKKYMDEIIEAYQLKNTDFLYKKMESSYWKYTGQKREEFEKQLNDLDTSKVTIGTVKKHIRNNTVIYSVNVSFGTVDKKINLIEDYPGSYAYSLDTFYKYNDNSKNNPVNNMGFFIKSIYEEIEQITINLDIYNNNKEPIFVKTESPNDVMLVLSNNKKISMTNVALGKETILGDTKTNKIFKFNISIEEQSEIEKIEFNNIIIDNILKPISFEIEL